jgi:hypothetical protein
MDRRDVGGKRDHPAERFEKYLPAVLSRRGPLPSLDRHQSVFRKKPASAKAVVESGFPSENATVEKNQSGLRIRQS